MLSAAGAGVLFSGLVRYARRSDAERRVAVLRSPVGPSGRLPFVDARLRAALDAAAVPWSPAEAVRWWLITCVALSLIGFSLGPHTGVLWASAAVVSGPTVLFLMRHRRSRALRRTLPTLLDEVARDLRSGGTVASAVDRLAAGDGILAREMAEVQRRTRLGLGVVDGLGAWANAHAWGPSSDDARVVVAALGVALSTGGKSAGPLEAMAEVLRDRDAALAEARAHAVQGRLSALVVGGLPVVALASSTVLDTEAGTVLFEHPLGRVALVSGVTLEVLAAMWMRRIVRIER